MPPSTFFLVFRVVMVKAFVASLFKAQAIARIRGNPDASIFDVSRINEVFAGDDVVTVRVHGMNLAHIPTHATTIFTYIRFSFLYALHTLRAPPTHRIPFALSIPHTHARRAPMPYSVRLCPTLAYAVA